MATKEYKNKGPIFLTQAKYDAKQALGEIPAGQECRITDWEAQEKLKDSTTIGTGETANIKTINNASILGEGNISITSTLPDWTGIPFNSNGRPSLKDFGNGSYEIIFLGNSSAGTLIYNLGTAIINTTVWSGYATRGPMVKIKSSATSDVNSYYTMEYNASGRLFIYTIDVSTGTETDVTPTGTAGTISTTIFYRKTN